MWELPFTGHAAGDSVDRVPLFLALTMFGGWGAVGSGLSRAPMDTLTFTSIGNRGCGGSATTGFREINDCISGRRNVKLILASGRCLFTIFPPALSVKMDFVPRPLQHHVVPSSQSWALSLLLQHTAAQITRLWRLGTLSWSPWIIPLGYPAPPNASANPVAAGEKLGLSRSLAIRVICRRPPAARPRERSIWRQSSVADGPPSQATTPIYVNRS